MQHENKTTCRSQGLTLVEMVVAMSLMAVIIAVLLPQLRAVQNSWDSQAGASETLQNARILIEHLNRNLSKAARIAAVSDPGTTGGYIEFIDSTANSFRYDVNSTSNYVEFGPVGSLSALAGPVSRLQFTCCDANDLDTPITDVNSIRSVTVETTLVNSASLDQDMTFSIRTYIRSNTLPSGSISKLSEPWLEFDTNMGTEPALCRIDQTHYLCAYVGPGSDGWVTVLTVDTGTWTITNQTPFEYDTSQGLSPALSQIDSTHYLCVYAGPGDDGWATVLTVNTGTWTITNQTPMEYDIVAGQTPALSKIDGTHYLCVYQGDAAIGWAVVFTVDTGSWTITKETAFQFDSVTGQNPDLSQIDSTSFLCAYGGPGGQGVAVVLNVNAVDWSISKETPLTFDGDQGDTPALSLIDSSHYVCSYTGLGDDSYAGVLEPGSVILP